MPNGQAVSHHVSQENCDLFDYVSCMGVSDAKNIAAYSTYVKQSFLSYMSKLKSIKAAISYMVL